MNNPPPWKFYKHFVGCVSIICVIFIEYIIDWVKIKNNQHCHWF